MLLACLAVGPAVAQRSLPSREETQGFTEPIRRSQMNFPGIGVVKQVFVKEGQAVKKGDPLMIQDVEIEEAELERLKLEAESTARIQYSEIDRDYKAKVLERKSSAGRGGAMTVFSKSEVEEAELDLARAEAQIKVVKEEMLANGIRVKQQAVKIDRMTLKSDVDGFVESIKVNAGELSSLDTDKPAIIVVQKDPLKVVITQLLSEQVAKLELGDTLQVRYLDEQEWRQAKLYYKTPFANHASGTQTIWLEMPNPENKDAGRHIIAKLPAKLLSNTNAPVAMPR